jgi:tagaturonate reductase
MEFYKGTELVEGALIGHRGEITYKIMDDKEVLEFFVENSDREIPQFVVNFLSNKSFWDQDLTELSGLADAVTEYLMDIRSLGMREALKKLD